MKLLEKRINKYLSFEKIETFAGFSVYGFNENSKSSFLLKTSVQKCFLLKLLTWVKKQQ